MTVTSPYADSPYLELIKHALCGILHEDPPIPVGWDPRSEFSLDSRVNGIDWPARAPTMIGLARLSHLQQCVETVLADDVPGDLIETGAWRGGACILMRAVLRERLAHDRLVWVADSFRGFPEDAARSEGMLGGDQVRMAVPLEQVQHNFRLYGLLDDQVRFLPGFFSDTLPVAPPGPLAVLRLDGDLYASTMDALANLYPRLSPGGFVIIDDWLLPGCRRAVIAYRDECGITEPLTPIPGSKRGGIEDTSVFWRKPAAGFPR